MKALLAMLLATSLFAYEAGGLSRDICKDGEIYELSATSEICLVCVSNKWKFVYCSDWDEYSQEDNIAMRR